MDNETLFEKQNIFGFINPNTYSKLVAKLDSEHFAIFAYCNKSKTKEEIGAINVEIRKNLLDFGIRSYNLIIRTDDVLIENILIFRNPSKWGRAEFYDMLLGLSMDFTFSPFLARLNSFQIRSIDANGDVKYSTVKDDNIIEAIERSFSDNFEDGLTYKLLGIAEPINNISRFTLNRYGISWL